MWKKNQRTKSHATLPLNLQTAQKYSEDYNLYTHQPAQSVKNTVHKYVQAVQSEKTTVCTASDDHSLCSQGISEGYNR
jgi:hypothetical protein